jgi:hypothetical protein
VTKQIQREIVLHREWVRAKNDGKKKVHESLYDLEILEMIKPIIKGRTYWEQEVSGQSETVT